MPQSRKTAPTVAQLKKAIDRGQTADKVDFPDPAASPLGTDAEAGGSSPSPAETATAALHETARPVKQDRLPKTRIALLGFVLVMVLAAVLSAALLGAIG